MSEFKYEKAADGIVTVTMDMDGPVNTMNTAYRDLMGATVARLEQEAGLKGVIIASAKTSFFAGGDLKEMLAVKKGEEAAFMTVVETIKSQLRRIEKLPVPVVAAINGAALGGGYEITLACNRRLLVADRAAVVGLPEVTLGLLPGAGGVTRLVSMIGLEKAAPYLLEGKQAKYQEALANGLVDEVVEKAGDLILAAKAWIKSNPNGFEQPWDRKGFKIPGGNMMNPNVAMMVSGATAMLAKKTRGLMPAPERIITCAAEAATVDFDTSLREESRNLAYLVTTPQAKNMITTLFFQMNGVNGGASRPKGIPPGKVGKLGVLGAGMMGQGIAYVAAMAGIDVVLRDVTQEAAERGKGYTAKLLDKAIEKGRSDEAKKAAVLARINPTINAADLDGCDLIVEAVFENKELKAQVTKETEHYLKPGGVFGSNTSTLPITMLAEAAQHPDNFIGIHFFSPVDKMPLIEIICGKKTSDETLARAFDFARQIGKTAIVVNDHLGFFTSRTFVAYLDEGARMLLEGLNPVVIENLARQVGMPVGPLAAQDEVSQKLGVAVVATHKAMGVLYSNSDTRGSTEVNEKLVTEFNRGGRFHGGGFYEYPKDGEKFIWPKLFALYGGNKALPENDVKDRLLFRQVIESIKCLEEGVLRTVADGNVGSILGIGAPPWTGGFLQFVNTYGMDRFIARTTELAAKYGERFTPPALLLGKAKAGEPFR